MDYCDFGYLDLYMAGCIEINKKAVEVDAEISTTGSRGKSRDMKNIFFCSEPKGPEIHRKTDPLFPSRDALPNEVKENEPRDNSGSSSIK